MNIDIKSEEFLFGYCYATGTIVWPSDDGRWVQEAVFDMANGYQGLVYYFQEMDE